MSKAYFNETQRFRQWWIYMIFAIVIASSIYTIVSIYPEVREEKSNAAWIMLISNGVLVPAAIFVLIRVFKLKTRIRKDGVYYQFFPLQLKEKFAAKEDIDSFEVRKYKPVSEYGGWGVKSLGNKYGRAINISGNMGLQLYLKNGKKLLIGTQKASEIEKAMNDMMEYNSEI